MGNWMSITDIAKEVRENLKKEFPDFTFSVVSRKFSGGRALDVSLMSGPLHPLVDTNIGYKQVNKYWLDREELEPWAVEMFKKVKEIVDTRNWNYPLTEADYVSVNYYSSLYVGKWDRPFVVK